MKRILLAIVAGIALVGCEKKDTTTDTVDSVKAKATNATPNVGGATNVTPNIGGATNAAPSGAGATNR